MKNIGDLTGIASTEIVGFGKDRPMADFANLGLNVDQRSSYSSSLADIIPIANIDNYKSLPSYEEIANWASEESIPSIYNEQKISKSNTAKRAAHQLVTDNKLQRLMATVKKYNKLSEDLQIDSIATSLQKLIEDYAKIIDDPRDNSVANYVNSKKFAIKDFLNQLNNLLPPNLSSQSMLKQCNKLHKSLNSLMGGYTLTLMAKLPNNDLEQAEYAKIYLANDGRYCVRDGNGEVHEDNIDLTSTAISLEALDKNLNNMHLKMAILAITLARGHTSIGNMQIGTSTTNDRKNVDNSLEISDLKESIDFTNDSINDIKTNLDQENYKIDKISKKLISDGLSKSAILEEKLRKSIVNKEKFMARLNTANDRLSSLKNKLEQINIEPEINQEQLLLKEQVEQILDLQEKIIYCIELLPKIPEMQLKAINLQQNLKLKYRKEITKIKLLQQDRDNIHAFFKSLSSNYEFIKGNLAIEEVAGVRNKYLCMIQEYLRYIKQFKNEFADDELNTLERIISVARSLNEEESQAQLNLQQLLATHDLNANLAESLSLEQSKVSILKSSMLDRTQALTTAKESTAVLVGQITQKENSVVALATEQTQQQQIITDIAEAERAENPLVLQAEARIKELTEIINRTEQEKNELCQQKITQEQLASKAEADIKLASSELQKLNELIAVIETAQGLEKKTSAYKIQQAETKAAQKVATDIQVIENDYLTKIEILAQELNELLLKTNESRTKLSEQQQGLVNVKRELNTLEEQLPISKDNAKVADEQLQELTNVGIALAKNTRENKINEQTIKTLNEELIAIGVADTEINQIEKKSIEDSLNIKKQESVVFVTIIASNQAIIDKISPLENQYKEQQTAYAELLNKQKELTLRCEQHTQSIVVLETTLANLQSDTIGKEKTKQDLIKARLKAVSDYKFSLYEAEMSLEINKLIVKLDLVLETQSFFATLITQSVINMQNMAKKAKIKQQSRIDNLNKRIEELELQQHDILLAEKASKVRISYIEGYELCAMAELPNNDPNQALAGKLYLDKAGHYIVCDTRGELQKGGIDFTSIQSQPNHLKFRKAILDITSKLDHTHIEQQKQQLQQEKDDLHMQFNQQAISIRNFKSPETHPNMEKKLDQEQELAFMQLKKDNLRAKCKEKSKAINILDEELRTLKQGIVNGRYLYDKLSVEILNLKLKQIELQDNFIAREQVPYNNLPASDYVFADIQSLSGIQEYNSFILAICCWVHLFENLLQMKPAVIIKEDMFPDCDFSVLNLKVAELDNKHASYLAQYNDKVIPAIAMIKDLHSDLSTYIDISGKHAQVAILSVNNQSDLINVKGLFAQETEQEIIKLTLHDHDTKIQYLLYEGEDLMKTYLSKVSLVNNKIHSCKLMIKNVEDKLQQLMLDSLRAMSYINESLEIKHRLELSLDKLIQDKGQMQNSYACEMSGHRKKINEIIGYSALAKLYHASSAILNAKYKKSGVAALTEVISAITQQLQEVKSRIPLFAEYSKGSNRLFGKRYFLWLKSECEFLEDRLVVYKSKNVPIAAEILSNITDSNKVLKLKTGEAIYDRSIGIFELKVKKDIFKAALNGTDREREKEYDRQMHDSLEEFGASYELYKKACLLEIEQQGTALKEKIKSGFTENREPWLSGENAESRHFK